MYIMNNFPQKSEMREVYFKLSGSPLTINIPKVLLIIDLNRDVYKLRIQLKKC